MFMVQWDQPVTVSLHVVLSLSHKMYVATISAICLRKIFSPFTYQLSKFPYPVHVKMSFFFKWMPCVCINESSSSYIWMTLTVIITAPCTALRWWCNDSVPIETRGRNDSALHFILDFCRLLSHYKVDLPWSQRGLWTIMQATLCDLKEQLKAKDCRLLL